VAKPKPVPRARSKRLDLCRPRQACSVERPTQATWAATSRGAPVRIAATMACERTRSSKQSKAARRPDHGEPGGSLALELARSRRHLPTGKRIAAVALALA
jgi:hypothetical protein